MADLRFNGIKVSNGRVSHRQGSGPVAGAVARVETSGDIDRRVTATRLILTGPFALGMRKKKDKRQLFLTVTGEGYGIMLELDPKTEKAARRFATRLSAMGSTPVSMPQSTPPTDVIPTSPPHGPPPGSVPPPDKIGQLTQLGALRDAGVLTQSEFEAQKAEILGTISTSQPARPEPPLPPPVIAPPPPTHETSREHGQLPPPPTGSSF